MGRFRQPILRAPIFLGNANSANNGERYAATSVLAWEPALGTAVDFTRHWRFDLAAEDRVNGPALILENETTTVVPAGWNACVNAVGHLILEHSA